MEVETRPPLVDGKLGLHAHSPSPDISLAITENDILLSDDEERELLQSPVEDRITCVTDTPVEGIEHEKEIENLPSKISSDSAKCNGDVASESVSDPANVFRTENDSGAVCATELSDADSKSCTGRDEDTTNEPNCTALTLSEQVCVLGVESDFKEQECSLSLSGKSSSSDGPCEDVSGTDMIVEDPCSLDASELHVDEQKLLEASSKDEKLEVENDLHIATAEGNSSVESRIDIKSPSEHEKEGANEVLGSEQLPYSQLSPESLKDFADDMDEMEIPQVIDISSICVSKESDDDPTSDRADEDVCGRVNEDETAAYGGAEENGEAGIVEDCETKTVLSGVYSETILSGEDSETAVADGAKPDTETADDVVVASQIDGETVTEDECEKAKTMVAMDGGDEAETDLPVIWDETDEFGETAKADKGYKADSETAGDVTVGSQRDCETVAEGECEEAGTVAMNNVTVTSLKNGVSVGRAVDEDKQNELLVTEGAEDVADEGMATGTTGVDGVRGDTPDAEENTESEFPAEDTMMDECLDIEQEENGSPEYQGMTDDILPIIESELDDIPVGEGNIFDTEVECDDGGMTSMLEGRDDTHDEDSANLPVDNDQDIVDDVASHPVSESSQTADEEREECSTKNILEDNLSLSDRIKLKRRASADTTQDSPPVKILKRLSSLDSLNEYAEKFDSKKSLDEFKKLCRKNLPAAPANIASEPLDIPIDIEENDVELALIRAKRRKIVAGVVEAVVDPSPSTTDNSTKSDGIQQKEQSVLVIDLDDDDDRPNSSSPAVASQTQVPEQAEPSKSAPRSALDVLFNGKKEITLNRKMFTRIMKSYVSQYLLTFSELGKATSLSLKANDTLNKIQSSVSNYEKQKEDFKSIMNKLIEDRQARKTWDETVVPPRATRSVGLQVCSVGSMYVKNADCEETPLLPPNRTQRAKVNSSVNQSQALAQQKQAFAQQQMAMAQSRAKQPVEQTNNIRPIAKKSVTPTNRPTTIRTVPAIKPVMPIKPKLPQFPVASPKLNGLKAVTVTRNPEPTANQNNSPLTVTTVAPNSRTFTLSNKGTFAVKSPQKPAVTPVFKQSSAILSKALVSSGAVPARGTITIPSKPATQNASKAVPIAVTHTPGTIQNSKNLASGPGRPGKTPAPVSANFLSSPSHMTSAVNRVLHSVAHVDKLKKPESTVPDTTIDLTDVDDDVPQPTRSSTSNNTTARKSTAPSRVNVSKVPTVGLGSKQMRHPALPPNPQNFNPTTAPPRPYLGICDTQTVTQGIMLTWHFNNVVPLRKISKFQVFAYQETKGDGEDSWKKVGDVDALPLPMACTLTQFREGYTYHFIVRALDEAGHVGPFSAPNTITLMRKTV